jgi:cell fate (sporulation/competence/biofilm development) regulator YmcA (YheA/YmcA/DUF963 family)
MEDSSKKKVMQLARRLRAKAAEFEKSKDFTRAENARLYASWFEETVKDLC